MPCTKTPQHRRQHFSRPLSMPCTKTEAPQERGKTTVSADRPWVQHPVPHPRAMHVFGCVVLLFARQTIPGPRRTCWQNWVRSEEESQIHPDKEARAEAVMLFDSDKTERTVPRTEDVGCQQCGVFIPNQRWPGKHIESKWPYPVYISRHRSRTSPAPVLPTSNLSHMRIFILIPIWGVIRLPPQTRGLLAKIGQCSIFCVFEKNPSTYAKAYFLLNTWIPH